MAKSDYRQLAHIINFLFLSPLEKDFLLHIDTLVGTCMGTVVMGTIICSDTYKINFPKNECIYPST